MDNLKDFFKVLKLIKLAENEKKAGRAKILEFIKQNPAISKHLPLKGLLSQAISSHVRMSKSWTISLITFLSVFLILGGISWAAENSLPNSVLYPMKVNVNDKIRLVMASSPEAKAKLEIKLSQKRLEEAEKLIINDKLSERAKTKLLANFHAQINGAKKQINILKSEGKLKHTAEISSDLESSLKTHEAILNTLANEKKGAGRVDNIVDEVKDNIEKVSRIRIQAEAGIKASGSYQGKNQNRKPDDVMPENKSKDKEKVIYTKNP